MPGIDEQLYSDCAPRGGVQVGLWFGGRVAACSLLPLWPLLVAGFAGCWLCRLCLQLALLSAGLAGFAVCWLAAGLFCRLQLLAFRAGRSLVLT